MAFSKYSPNAVLVSGFPEFTNEDNLTIYFQSHRRSGGGDVNGVLIRPNGTAVVKFSETSAASNVLKRDHEFGGESLVVRHCPIEIEPEFEDSDVNDSSSDDEIVSPANVDSSSQPLNTVGMRYDKPKPLSTYYDSDDDSDVEQPADSLCSHFLNTVQTRSADDNDVVGLDFVQQEQQRLLDLAIKENEQEQAEMLRRSQLSNESLSTEKDPSKLREFIAVENKDEGDEILDIAAFLPSTDDVVEEEEKEDVDGTIRMQRGEKDATPVKEQDILQAYSSDIVRVDDQFHPMIGTNIINEDVEDVHRTIADAMHKDLRQGHEFSGESLVVRHCSIEMEPDFEDSDVNDSSSDDEIVSLANVGLSSQPLNTVGMGYDKPKPLSTYYDSDDDSDVEQPADSLCSHFLNTVQTRSADDNDMVGLDFVQQEQQRLLDLAIKENEQEQAEMLRRSQLSNESLSTEKDPSKLREFIAVENKDEGDEILDIAAFLPSTDDDVEEEEKEDVDRTVRMQREYEVLPPVEAKMEKRPESFTIQSSSSSSSDDNYTREDMDRKKRQYDWEEKSSDGSSIVVIPDQENMKESKEDSDLDEDDVENTIEVTDFSANTTVELLEMYFENRRKSGGGKVLKVEIASEKPYVTFEDPKVIDTVLQKTHLLSQCNLKVRIAPPLPPRDKRKVVVKNISEKTTRDGLELYMENNSGCNVEKIENALEADVAMVTFGSPPDYDEMFDKISKRALDGSFLHLHPVSVTNSILVAGISQSTSTDTLELYFENKRRSGGGDIQDTSYDSDTNTAVVQFEDPKVVESVCQNRHILNGADLTVVAYHEYFGPPACMSEFFKPNLPHPFTIEVDPNIIEFIKNAGCQHVRDFNEMMKLLNVSLIWDGDKNEVVVMPTLTLDLDDIKTLINVWESQAKDAIEEFLDDFSSREIKSPVESWQEICTRLEELKSTSMTSELWIAKDDTNKSLTITGLKAAVSMAINSYQKITKEIEEKMKYEATIITDQCSSVKREKLQLLQATSDAVSIDENIKMDIAPDQGSVMFRGPTMSVTGSKLKVLEMLPNMVEKELKLSDDIVRLMQSERGYNYVMQSLKCHVVVTFEQGLVKITGCNKQDCDSAYSIIKDLIRKDTIQVLEEWIYLLKGSELAKLLSNLTAECLVDFEFIMDKKPIISIVGSDNDLRKAKQDILTFLKMNAIKRVNVPIKYTTELELLFSSHHREFINGIMEGLHNDHVKISQIPGGVLIEGTDHGVKNAKLSISAVLKAFETGKKKISKPGIRKLIGDEQNNGWLKMVEKDHFCAIEVVKGTDDSMVPGKASSKPVPALQLSRSIDVTTIADSDEPVFPQHRHHLSGKRKVIPRRNLNKLSTPEGIDVILKDGDITQEQADVLVNTCGSDFKLTGSGGVANAFGVAGGPKLQQYCAGLGTASKGSVIETDPAGILKCKSIYHAVTPSTSSNGEQKQAISQIMSKCFQMMTGDNYDSIAFPAIGTGNLNYPRKLVAAEMYNEVFKFSQRYLSSVKKVYFVAFDQQTIQAFNDELSARQDMSNPSYRSMSLPGKEAFMVTAPSPGQQRMVVGPITVEVQRGDITAENTDIIVNCCSGNIGQGGGVTNAIMSAGGSAVKQACAAYTNQPKGSVCETVSGKLSCKKLYHLVNTTASQLGNSIVKCLTMAENSGMTSIAFPAAGTGSHGIPLQDCADAIFDGIKSFVQQCQPRSLKLVRVTVFQQQQLTVFHSAMNSGIPQFSRSKSNPTFTTKKKDVHSFLTKQSAEKSSMGLINLIVTATDHQHLQSAMEEIDRLVNKQISNRTISSPILRTLSTEEHDLLMSIGLSQDVTVKKGPGNSDSLILEGAPDEVMNVFSDITDFLNMKNKKKAEIHQNRVQWYWYDGKCKQMVAFDPITNMLIEDAHQKNLPSVSYKLNDNGQKQTCQIDFNTEEEIILTTGARNKVVREDLELKG